MTGARDNTIYTILYIPMACNYLSMLGLKLNHVSKRGHWYPRDPLIWTFLGSFTDTVALIPVM